MNGVQKILHLENADVDEKLENYFDTLSGFQQKEWYTYELYLRKKLGK